MLLDGALLVIQSGVTAQEAGERGEGQGRLVGRAWISCRRNSRETTGMRPPLRGALEGIVSRPSRELPFGLQTLA